MTLFIPKYKIEYRLVRYGDEETIIKGRLFKNVCIGVIDIEEKNAHRESVKSVHTQCFTAQAFFDEMEAVLMRYYAEGWCSAEEANCQYCSSQR